MSHDSRYLNLAEAATHLGTTIRWLRRHYPALIQAGVDVFRIPRGSIKGRLLFGKASLDQYMTSCRIQVGTSDR